MAELRTAIRIWGFPGLSTTFSQPLLANRTIVTVTKEGAGYDPVVSSPVGLQYTYDAATGSFSFDPNIPFTVSVIRRRLIFETINVTYQ